MTETYSVRPLPKVSNVRIGSGRASIGTTLIAELYTKCSRKKWRLLWGLFFENSPFLREFMRYLMQTTPQRRQGRGSSGPESLFEVNRRSRKSKSRRSSKAKRRVKSPPDSGTVDSDWYVFCFTLAHFTLHSSWHVLGCVNLCLLSTCS